MPCPQISEITALDVVDGVPGSIRIRGTMGDCHGITVTLGPFVRTVATANWEITFDNPSASGATVRCGDSLKINVKCEGNEACNFDDLWTVTCPAACPTIVDIADEGGACQNGSRSVQLTPVVTGAEAVYQYAWEFGDGSSAIVYASDQPTGAPPPHLYGAPGTGTTSYTVLLSVVDGNGCTDLFSRTIHVHGCEAACPQLTTITAVMLPCESGLRRVVLDVGVSGGGASGFLWSFGDGTSQTISGGNASTSNLFAPGNYTVRVRLLASSSCPESSDVLLAISVPKCTDPDNKPENGDGWDWGKLCPGLLFAWLVAYVAAWVLYYVAMDVAAAVSLGVATVGIAAWALACCRTCMRNPIKCCTFIRWMILAHQVILTIYGILAGTESLAALEGVCASIPGLCTAIVEFLGGEGVGNTIAWWSATIVGLLWGCRFASQKCRGAFPVLLRPSTWPRSKC
jgi:hypothetical protein